MGAGADAGVIGIAPVSEIVAALLTRRGMVRDFIGREAARRRSYPASARNRSAAFIGIGGDEIALRGTAVSKRVPGSMVSW